MPAVKPKIIFFGTSDFAATILTSLADKFLGDIILIVTQPDQPVGRKQILTAPPVKVTANSLNLPIIQPEKLDTETETELRNYNADLFIVAAYGALIPETILSLPSLGCLNIHPSLLPLYRGPSPIQTCLLNGDTQSGISLMLLDKKMDHGPLITQVKYPIKPNDDYLTLSAKLADKSAELLISTLPKFIAGKLKPQEQNHSAATFTKIIQKSAGEINWQNTAPTIYNQWRAFFIWPNIFSTVKINSQDVLLKFNEIKISDEHPAGDHTLGQIFVHNKKLLAACGESSYLEILKLQPEGKKVMTASEFINGYLR